MFKLNRKIHKSVSDIATVEVIEVDGVRSLYLSSNTNGAFTRMLLCIVIEPK